tara:strand:- start:176 stop:715 length:540 start_codon:yes stop_codon:yes gene_type:complete
MTPLNTEEAERKAKRAEYHRKWREANPEKRAATQKKYREANREQETVRSKKYREENPEKYAAYQKKYSESNPEQVAASVKKYREANPETLRACTLRRRARMHGAAGWSYTTASHVSARWEAFGGRCWMCGGEATATDHVKPISKGGAHWPSNLRPACAGCNLSKQAKWPYPTTTQQETT